MSQNISTLDWKFQFADSVAISLRVGAFTINPYEQIFKDLEGGAYKEVGAFKEGGAFIMGLDR